MSTCSRGRPSGAARAGFNGLFNEARTQWQFLGNGHRAYDPALMRFHAPDRLSPFDEGGLNAYAYCCGEPINNADPNGKLMIPTLLIAVPAFIATVAGIGAGSTKDDSLREGLATLAVVAGLLATASLAAMSGRMQRASYTLSRPALKVQRHPGGSYLKGQPRQRTGGGALIGGASRLQRGVTRKVLGKPRFRYRKAPAPDSARIRKIKPVERAAMLASGYPPLRDKPDSALYLRSLVPPIGESTV